MTYEVGFKLLVRPADDGLKEHLAHVMDELVDLEESDDRVQDVDMSATLTSGEVTITMAVGVDRLEAVHAAGGSTPSWDEALAPGKFRVDVREATQRPLTSA